MKLQWVEISIGRLPRQGNRESTLNHVSEGHMDDYQQKKAGLSRNTSHYRKETITTHPISYIYYFV